MTLKTLNCKSKLSCKQHFTEEYKAGMQQMRKVPLRKLGSWHLHYSFRYTHSTHCSTAQHSTAQRSTAQHSSRVDISSSPWQEAGASAKPPSHQLIVILSVHSSQAWRGACPSLAHGSILSPPKIIDLAFIIWLECRSVAPVTFLLPAFLGKKINLSTKESAQEPDVVRSTS